MCLNSRDSSKHTGGYYKRFRFGLGYFVLQVANLAIEVLGRQAADPPPPPPPPPSIGEHSGKSGREVGQKYEKRQCAKIRVLLTAKVLSTAYCKTLHQHQVDIVDKVKLTVEYYLLVIDGDNIVSTNLQTDHNVPHFSCLVNQGIVE